MSPQWFPRDLSEIKPGSFSQSSRFQAPQRGKEMEDPNYRYVKRLLKGRERDPELEMLMTGKGYVPRSTMKREESTASEFEISSGLLQDMSVEEEGDAAALKEALRAAARDHAAEAKSGIKPAAAHKIYAWRAMLDERERRAKDFECSSLPSSAFKPDQINRLLDNLYYRSSKETGSLYKRDGFWQKPRLGPNITRDKNGLRILENLEPEAGPVRPLKSQDKEYYYQWPEVDSNTGYSLRERVTAPREDHY